MFKIEIDKEIHFELISSHHAEELLALYDKNIDHINRWLMFPKDKSIERLQKGIEESLKSYAKDEDLVCLIFYNHKMVGLVSMWGMSSSPKRVRKGELTYWLDKDHQNRGIMRRSVKKIVEIGFTQYELDKIVVRVAVGNNKSINIPLKLGFSLDGVLRRDMKINGEFQDLNIYSLLRE